MRRYIGYISWLVIVVVASLVAYNVGYFHGYADLNYKPTIEQLLRH